MKTRHIFQRCGIVIAALALSSSAPAGPGDFWLKSWGFTAQEWDLDHDGDGFTAREEYFFGTNPLSAASKPPVLLSSRVGNLFTLSWPSVLGVNYRIEHSETLQLWEPRIPSLPGTGLQMQVGGNMGAGNDFFRLGANLPGDFDGDGLSDVEEAMIGTNPRLVDTDGDGLSDGAEVFLTFTNPLVADPFGATIRGQVMTDPNGDGNTADGAPVQGAEVYLDSNYNGVHDTGEPLLITGADGRYEFMRVRPGVYHVRQQLAAGQFQTKPVPAASPVLNGLPDEVVNYTHVPGGNLPVAYGAKAVPGVVVPYIIFPPVAQAVSPNVVLQPIGRRDEIPAAGIWSFNDHLTIPQGASILLRFDETIINGPGADFVIYKLTQGDGEEATLEVGYTPATMTAVATITDTGFGGSSARPVDLGALGVTGPIRYLRLTSLNNLGTFAGFEFVGVEAIHFAQPDANALEVIVLGNETHDHVDFARHFRDDAPTVFLFVNGNDFRAGGNASVTVQADDDITLTSRTLTANGVAIALNAQGTATVPLTVAGTMTLVATATDSGGHTSMKEATVYVNNADGSSPFSPNLTGASTGSAFSMRFVSPPTGAIVAANTPVVASIGGALTPNWQLDYAPVGLINPYDMAAPDPDWIPLGSGSGFLTNQTVGTFPAGILPNGIYFLRLRATPTGGGSTSYHGQVVAKGVNAADIQPHVTITSPVAGSPVPLTVPITGSITSTRPLVEWFAEYALASTVDLNNLGSDAPPWKRFAQGTTTIANNVIANFDTSLVPDGSYIIRIVAWNDIRLGWVEPLAVEVAGTVKLGRLRREFIDLTLPLAGIPIEIRRVYDSFAAGKDRGLGFGWSLGFLDPGIGETVAGTGTGIFGATPFRDGTRVYINTPEGKRVGFTFHAEYAVSGFLGNVYRAKFSPDPGVYEKLEVPEGNSPFLTIDSSGNTFIFFLGFAWNPSTYILTTEDGIRYTYDESGGFIQALDLNGNTLTATANGLRHSTGLSVDFIRDGNGRIAQINAPGGITIHYAYNAAGDLVSVTDNDGRVTQFSYHATPAHFLKDVTDPLGRVGIIYEYDASGRLAAIIDANGQRREQTWNPGAFSGTLSDRNGNVQTLVYDSRGNILTESNALGQVTAYQYNDAANPDRQTSRTDALGRTIAWQYNAKGKITFVASPQLFYDSSATYDAAGRILTARDFDGQISTYTYDALGNLATRNEAGKVPESYTYTPEGLLSTTTTTETDGPQRTFTTRQEYNAQGKPVSIRDDHGFSATTNITPDGKLTGVTLAGGRSYGFTYDAAGTLSSETDPLGRSTTIVLQADGTRRATDRLGRLTNYLTAADEKVDLVTLPNGSSITPARDAERNLTGLTDGVGNTTQWQYDALNRAVRQTDPTGAFSTRAYDAVGNVSEIINRNGRRRTFVYDMNNHLTHERWHDAGGAIIRDFTYNYFYGTLANVTEGATSWDFLGTAARPSQASVAYPGQSRRNVNYVWDQNGIAGSGTGSGGCCGGAEGSGAMSSPTKITVNGGADFFIIGAAYDGPNLQRLTWSPPNDFFGGPDIHFIRGTDGTLSEIRRLRGPDVAAPPKSRTTFTWDLLGRMVNYSHLDIAGAPLHADAPATFTRDAESRITAIARASDTAGYTHDVMDQLTAVTHTAGAAESYTYNIMGVRTASHLNAGPSTVGPANRLLTAGTLTFTYDAEGNVSEKTNTATAQVTRYGYDHRNQLVLATIHPDAVSPATTTAAFEYDYLGRMMSRTINGAKTWIVHDRQMPICEFADGANSCNAAFLYSPDRLDDFHGVWRASTGQRLFLKDQLGTIQGATDADGALVYWSGYDAFGNPVGAPPATTDAIRFTGRFYHEALGLYEMRDRFYDPQLGRFTQEDPVRFHGGDMNLYRYVGNNPLNFRDPTGRNAAIEYLELHVSIIRPGALCSFASCVSHLWSSVATAVINRTGTNQPPRNCALDLIGNPITPSSTPSAPSVLLTAVGIQTQLPRYSLPPGNGNSLILDFLSVAECLRTLGQ